MNAFLQKRDRLRVRTSLFISALLLVTTGSLQAQIRERWRTGLTNFWPMCVNPASCGLRTNYTTTTAVVDGSGQTTVGGQIEIFSTFTQEAAFVAKFGSEGTATAFPRSGCQSLLTFCPM